MIWWKDWVEIWFLVFLQTNFEFLSILTKKNIKKLIQYSYNTDFKQYE